MAMLRFTFLIILYYLFITLFCYFVFLFYLFIFIIYSWIQLKEGTGVVHVTGSSENLARDTSRFNGEDEGEDYKRIN